MKPVGFEMDSIDFGMNLVLLVLEMYSVDFEMELVLVGFGSGSDGRTACHCPGGRA